MDAALVAQWLRLFIEPDQVTELRAIDVAKDRYTHTVAGFYDHAHLADMAKAAVELSPDSVGVYFVPNPIKESLLARCANRTKPAKKEEQVADKHITRRHWLLVDADPVRVDGVSSTDDEKATAWDAINKARIILASQFDMTRHVLSDSSNGYHLLYRIDWPVEDGGQAQKILNSIASQIDSEAVKIDRKVFNPSRIVKLYGTTSRKGDSTPDRPHRPSKVLEVCL